MVFTDLNSTIQNLVLLQYEFIGKAILLLILVGFSFYYVRNFKQKPNSAYKFTKMFKGLIYIMCWVTLAFSPLFVLFLAFTKYSFLPQKNFSSVKIETH